MRSTSVAAHLLVDADEERCPLCKQPLPHNLNAKELAQQLEAGRTAAANAEATRLRAEFARSQAAAVQAEKTRLSAEHTEREKAIRAEAKTQAQSESKTAIQAANAAAQKAAQGKQLAEEQLARTKSGQDELVKGEIAKALRKQREVLDKSKSDDLRRKDAEAFQQNQRMQKQVDSLKRQLEQKNSSQLGEGAEIDLYETLREHYERDRIRRVKKGEAGADIEHEVIHNNRACGSILYDSKNHRAWRDDFVEKLKTDQLAAKADHAILATSVFPAGEQQICVRGGVIIANPARVVHLVRIIRAQIVEAHRLRLGVGEKARKTEKLYEFINSGRCQQLMARYDAIVDGLSELDEREVDAHKRTWEKRGKLIRDAEKVHADFKAEIDRIIEGGESA